MSSSLIHIRGSLRRTNIDLWVFANNSTGRVHFAQDGDIDFIHGDIHLGSFRRTPALSILRIAFTQRPMLSSKNDTASILMLYGQCSTEEGITSGMVTSKILKANTESKSMMCTPVFGDVEISAHAQNLMLHAMGGCISRRPPLLFFPIVPFSCR
jgi:hypothetical protein